MESLTVIRARLVSERNDAMDRSREHPDKRTVAYLLGEAAGLDQAIGLIDVVLGGGTVAPVAL